MESWVSKLLQTLRPGQAARMGLLACSAWLFLFSAAARAQGDSQPTFTLHVYNNLVQFPTIVLNDDLKQLPPIPRDKFSVTLDDGPPFHPTQMRREGDDPMSLAVLLDAGGTQKDFIAAFPGAFAALMPAFLHSNDHLSIYAEDCTLMRTAHNVPASQEVALKALQQVLSAPKLHGDKPKAACGKELHLWDYLALITSDLAKEPGRRVILLVSYGDESKSTIPFATLSHMAAARGVAVFRMEEDDASPAHANDLSFGRLSGLDYATTLSSDDLTTLLCNTSGGMTLHSGAQRLVKSLQDFIMLLRNRYIIEFPRPDDSVGGRHEIAITIPGRHAFIRYTGATTPLPDPQLAADPNTLPSAASPAVTGKHRPPTP